MACHEKPNQRKEIGWRIKLIRSPMVNTEDSFPFCTFSDCNTNWPKTKLSFLFCLMSKGSFGSYLMKSKEVSITNASKMISLIENQTSQNDKSLCLSFLLSSPSGCPSIVRLWFLSWWIHFLVFWRLIRADDSSIWKSFDVSEIRTIAENSFHTPSEIPNRYATNTLRNGKWNCLMKPFQTLR